jgi:hypothetical protein
MHSLQRCGQQRKHRPHSKDHEYSKACKLRQVVRARPVHVPGLDKPCNAPPHWHCSFHGINRPQLGRGLKDFMRLVAIGSAYTANGIKQKT